MTKTFHLRNKKNQLVGIRVETEKDIFNIPVLDSRVDNKRLLKFEKQQNQHRGSRYFKPSYSVAGYSYN